MDLIAGHSHGTMGTRLFIKSGNVNGKGYCMRFPCLLTPTLYCLVVDQSREKFDCASQYDVPKGTILS